MRVTTPKMVNETMKDTDIVIDKAKDYMHDRFRAVNTVSALGITRGESLYIPIGQSSGINWDINWDRALEVSYLASRQVEEVAMTPYMRNALLHFGDIGVDERLKVDAPVTKAELYIQNKVEKELIRQFGSKREKYDRRRPVLDKRHYAVDCWRNFKTGTAMRDIQPGQSRQREEGFATFRKAAPRTEGLFDDPYYKVALRSVIYDMPQRIQKSNEFKDWSGPFANKHTQTSFPFFYRDDVIVSAENDQTGDLKPYYGKTYGELCIEVARQIVESDLSTLDYAVNVGYGRNQRGKGRPLIAMSRIPAVIYNQMTQPETERCKMQCPFFIGYNSRSILRNAMAEQALWATDNNYAMENFDYHAFDQSISPEWLATAGAVWWYLAADKRSKAVVDERTLYTMSGYLVDGIASDQRDSIAPIQGRQFSGVIETNKSENVINSVASTACMLRQHDQWLNDICRRAPYARMYIGDDCCLTYDKQRFSHDTYVEDMIDNYGFEVHPDKGEFGAFFLQNRLFLDDDGLTFTYPWPRVLRSCLFREQSRGLGPAGWTLATWSQLANISEYREGLAFVRDIILEFDEQKLMLDKPIGAIIKQVQEEDEQAIAENKRARTTFEIVNDGDPGKVQLDRNQSRYLTELQSVIRDA